MGLPVVIDVGVADPPPDTVAALIEACTRAVADSECHLLRDAPQTLYRAVAIITWEAPDRVRIEVGLRQEQGTEWRSRSLTFQDSDVELERFRSVGFVVGTLAGEQPGEPVAPPEPPEPPEPPRAQTAPPTVPLPPPPRPVPAAAPPAGFLGVRGTLGAALDQGPPRFGGALKAGVSLSTEFFFQGQAGISVRPEDERGLSLQWLEAGLGIGWRALPAEPFGFELRLEGAVEQFQAQASGDDSIDARQRVLVLGRLGLDGIYAFLPRVAVVAGIDGVVRPAPTFVRVGGETAGSTALIELGASAGVRFSF